MNQGVSYMTTTKTSIKINTYFELRLESLKYEQEGILPYADGPGVNAIYLQIQPKKKRPRATAAHPWQHHQPIEAGKSAADSE